ncbi:hypothetical protein DDB_G0284851 [Dictyostelium discoideum AX4]|uniref:Putative uncharacterized protein DDB_G0284851 n=1 Tax=Dictyostelium discoideum TaxID=44689 RepID=Y5793_DICDI|nr:hypothetical protein DDB_G0284851 [Dictyostelium discoideum AX4]Q54P25.1 RecName: Full=Putative uncharacterized protein DDB_G0284851 [Dictyostelium discoideum]EAL65015.1 hypothetical protein DDB_G0284851 [Dictyostelium discoideum AX4]|eukprot:XP_638370.1 hypothetical protein DDB_G0284851 [Dictyostelium discoideum AX4]
MRLIIPRRGDNHCLNTNQSINMDSILDASAGLESLIRSNSIVLSNSFEECIVLYNNYTFK